MNELHIAEAKKKAMAACTLIDSGMHSTAALILETAAEFARGANLPDGGKPGQPCPICGLDAWDVLVCPKIGKPAICPRASHPDFSDMPF